MSFIFILAALTLAGAAAFGVATLAKTRKDQKKGEDAELAKPPEAQRPVEEISDKPTL